jgi:hypothetical protein
LQFSLQAASPETFGYILVYAIIATCYKYEEIDTLEVTCLSCELKVKGKVKAVPVLVTKHHAMKPYWGSGSIAPLIL